MNESPTFVDMVMDKLNVASCSLLSAVAMIFAGIYLCISQINEAGAIRLDSLVFSGEIQSGSLGLMVMFLGVMVVLAGVLGRRPAGPKHETIEIEVNGAKVVCTGLSFRKV